MESRGSEGVYHSEYVGVSRFGGEVKRSPPLVVLAQHERFAIGRLEEVFDNVRIPLGGGAVKKHSGKTHTVIYGKTGV